MSKTIHIITLLLILPLLSVSQSWTNYNTGYNKHYSLAMTDSMIFVGGEQIINVYDYNGEHKQTKLTNGSNYSSCVDKNGIISFNNKYNILQFDGENWTYIRPDIPNNLECTSLACDKENNLWATFSNNQANSAYISKFNGTEWKNINNFADTIALSFANEIVIDTNNIVYAGITVHGNNWTYGIVRIDQNDTTIYHNWNSNCSIGFRISSHLDWKNNVWFGGSQNDLLRFDGTEWYREGDAPSLSGKSFTSIYLDQDNKLWLGTSDALYIQNDENWNVYTENDELLYDYIWDIKPDLNNNIWIAASPNPNYSGTDENNGCLSRINSNIFSHYQPNTLKGEAQKIMFSDNEIWVLSNEGFSVLKDSIWHINDINTSIPYEEIKDFTIDYYNNVWMISETVLYKLNHNNSLEQFTTIQGITFEDNRCITSFIDNIWMNSSPYILKFDGEVWSTANLEESLSPFLNIIVPTNDVTIYTGSPEGAIRFGCCSISVYTEDRGLVNNNVKDFAFEGEKVWFATEGGLSEFDGSDYINYIQDSANIISYNNYSSIHIDKNGHKWVGCPKGLYKYDNYNFHFAQPNGKDEPINFITEDSEENLWFAGKYGISKLTLAPTEVISIENGIPELSIYPNPATDKITVLVDDLKQDEIIEIYTITGELVHQQKALKTNQIILTGFSSGVYLLKLNKSNKLSRFVIM